MRQKFSYILCAIFMLFGTHQIIQGASIVADIAAETLDRSFAKVAGETGAEVGGLATQLESSVNRMVEDQMKALKSTTLKNVAEDSAASNAVRNAVQDSIVRSIMKSPEILDAIKMKSASLSGEIATKINSAASSDLEKVLKGLDPKDSEFAAKVQNASNAAGELQARAKMQDTGAAYTKGELDALKDFSQPVKLPGRPVDLLQTVTGSVGSAADAIATSAKSLPRVAGDIATGAREFVYNPVAGLKAADRNVGKFAVDAQTGVIKAKDAVVGAAKGAGKAVSESKLGKIALGAPKYEKSTTVIERRGVLAGEKTYKDFTIKPKISDEDAKFIEDDTIFDSQGKPVKYPEDRPDGLGEFARESDPAYPKNEDKSFKKVAKMRQKEQGGMKQFDKDGKPEMEKIGEDFAPPITKEVPGKSIIGPDGKPEVWSLKDLVGDDPAAKCAVGWVVWAAKGLGGMAHMLVMNGLVMGMAMSIPNQIMSSFMAERQQQAALATVARPVTFGGITMQIPDGFINQTMPSSSLKMYVGIPDGCPDGDQPSAAHPVVGPDAGNPISQKIAELANDQVRAFFATVMSAANEMKSSGDSGNIPRYSFYSGNNTHPSWYDNRNAHIFCSYSPQSWNTWGSSAVSDPGFAGLMIDLNTGYVFAEDGTTEGAAPAPLLGNVPNGPISVQTFLSNYEENITAQGKTFDFSEYTSGGQPDVDNHPDGSLARQFSSYCIANKKTDKPAGGNNSGFGDVCMVGGFRNSVVATSLVRLAAGACIGADGKEIVLAEQTGPSFSSQETQSEGSKIRAAQALAQAENAAANDWWNDAVSDTKNSIAKKILGSHDIVKGVAKQYGRNVKQSMNASVKTQALVLPTGVKAPAAAKPLGAAPSSSSVSKQPTAAQIAAFYNDPAQMTNLAMQDRYREEQTLFAMEIYDALSADQQKSFAKDVAALAGKSDLESLMNDLFKMLSSSEQAAFQSKVSTFKDTTDVIAYLFAQVFSDSLQSECMHNVIAPIDSYDQRNPMNVCGSQDHVQKFISFISFAKDHNQANDFQNILKDQTSIINVVHASLPESAKPAFEKDEKLLKNNEDIVAYLYPFIASARIKVFLTDAIFDIVSPSAKIAFFKKYATSQQLQAFVTSTSNEITQGDKDTFAENSLILAARSQVAQAPGRSLTNVTHAADSSMQADITSDLMLQQAVAEGALGGVVPIYGFADAFESYLNANFSATLIQQQESSGGLGAEILHNQTAASQIKNIGAGVMHTSGAVIGNNQKVNIQGAPNLNYPAFGVYIYECLNTPFAKELAKLTNAQALDYIVFFDQDLNQVPLQVVSPNPRNSNFPEYIVNPAIAYWASLICYIGNGSGPLDEFMGRYQDTSGTIQTFFPLYTLTGDLVFVQGATNAMDTVISSINKPQQGALIGTQDLYNQILAVAKLEVATYQQGPFYAPYNLHEAPETMWMAQSSATSSATNHIVPYVGMAPYPMPLNLAETSGPTDYLIPFVKEGGQSVSVQLPNPYVAMFVSLVTDIIFVVDVDATTGQATFRPNSYEYSQYNPTSGGYNPNAVIAGSKTGGVWLKNLANAGATIPQALKDDVAKQRSAWISYVTQDLTDATYTAQLGFPFGSKYKLGVASSDDYKNGNYMYRCSPSPSGLKLAGDIFVMSAQQALPNPTVGLIANAQNPQPYIVSIATGYMYDSNGAVQKDKAGKPIRMEFGPLLSLVNTNQRSKGGKGLSDAMSKQLTQLNTVAQQLALVKQGPYEFGSLVFHLYTTDIENGNYVYFTQDSSGTPNDYFVVVKSISNPFVFGGQIDASTEHMVSLVTGELYTRTGVAGVWPDITTLLSAVQNTMSISALDIQQINKLNALFIATASNEAVEKSNVAAQLAAQKALVAEDIANIAANIVSAPYLPSPYDSLVQDPGSKKYYRVTPDSDGKPFLIFDFNATSSGVDSTIGAVFQADGTFVTIMKGVQLVGMRQQFGVQVSSTGVQTLTIPHIVGNMNLSAQDKLIKPGTSGTALLHSSDSQFPTPGISAVTSGTKTYNFYYHTFLSAYFAYVVDSASKEQYYISLSDGTAYNSDGSARVVHYQIARDSKGNPLVVAQDTQGLLTAILADPNAEGPTAGKYINFVNVAFEKNGSYGENTLYGALSLGVNDDLPGITILQLFPAQSGTMKFNPNASTYKVYDATASTNRMNTFTLDVNSQVQILSYVPVDSNGQIATKPAPDLLKVASLILQAGSITEVIFNGVLYKNPTKSGNTLTFKNGSDVIAVEAVAATSSCAAYAVVSQGAQKYLYSYAYQTMIADDFTAFKQNVIAMNSAISSTAKAVLCENMHQMALKAVTSADVKNIPSGRSGALTNSIKGMQYDGISGKYFAPIQAADYSYFGQAGFVDIENGCFYDSKFMPSGYSLVLPDYVALLNKLNVVVVYNMNANPKLKQKTYDLVYRTASVVSKENASLAQPGNQKGVTATS